MNATTAAYLPPIARAARPAHDHDSPPRDCPRCGEPAHVTRNLFSTGVTVECWSGCGDCSHCGTSGDVRRMRGNVCGECAAEQRHEMLVGVLCAVSRRMLATRLASRRAA